MQNGQTTITGAIVRATVVGAAPRSAAAPASDRLSGVAAATSDFHRLERFPEVIDRGRPLGRQRFGNLTPAAFVRQLRAHGVELRPHDVGRHAVPTIRPLPTIRPVAHDDGMSLRLTRCPIRGIYPVN